MGLMERLGAYTGEEPKKKSQSLMDRLGAGKELEISSPLLKTPAPPSPQPKAVSPTLEQLKTQEYESYVRPPTFPGVELPQPAGIPGGPFGGFVTEDPVENYFTNLATGSLAAVSEAPKLAAKAVRETRPEAAFETMQNIGKVYPVIDAAVTTAYNFVITFPAEMGGFIGGLASDIGEGFAGEGWDLESARRGFEDVNQLFAATPFTEGGRQLVDAVFGTLDKAATKLGEVATDKTGDPRAGATVYAGSQLLPYIIGGRLIRKGRASGKPLTAEDVRAEVEGATQEVQTKLRKGGAGYRVPPKKLSPEAEAIANEIKTKMGVKLAEEPKVIYKPKTRPDPNPETAPVESTEAAAEMVTKADPTDYKPLASGKPRPVPVDDSAIMTERTLEQQRADQRKVVAEMDLVSMDAVHKESESILKEAKDLNELSEKMQELTSRYENNLDKGFADAFEENRYREWGDEIMEKINQARRQEGLIEEPPPEPTDVQLNTMIPINEVPKQVMEFLRDLGKREGTDAIKTMHIFRNKDLFDKTNFWLAKDGMWRYEIDDSAARYSPPQRVITLSKLGKTSRVGIEEVLDYPEVFKTIPELKKVDVIFDPKLEVAGMYDQYDNIIIIKKFGDKSAFIHELQHAVNHKTGSVFKGTNYIAAGGRRQYLADPGEMEARLAETRMRMSADARKRIPPWDTLDRMLERDFVFAPPEGYGVKLYSGGEFQKMYEHFVAGVRKSAEKKGQKLSPELNEMLDRGDIVSRRKVQGRYRLPIYRAELEILKAARKLKETFLRRGFENPIRTFEEAGGEPFLDLTIHQYHARELGAIRLQQALSASRKELFKGTSAKMRRRVAVHAIDKQKGGRGKLLKSGIKEKDIPEKLVGKEAELYDALRDRFESWYRRLSNLRVAIGKEPFPKTDDYFTFIRNYAILENAGFRPLDMPTDVLNAQFTKMGATPFKFAIPRKGALYKLELDPVRILEIYEKSAARHIQLSPFIAKMRELQSGIKDPETGKKFRLVNENPILARSLHAWTNHIAGMRSPTFQLPPAVENIMMRVNSNLAASILGANARSAMIQISALRNTVAEIGFTHSAKGVLSLISPKARNFALKKSKVLSQRTYDVTVEDALREIKSGKIGAIKRIGAKAAMKPLQILDMETAKATWQGAYDFGRSKLHMSEGRAINYADDVVTKTQASAMPGDVAPVQRSVAGKFFTLFQTFTINDWNYLVKDVLGLRGGGPLTKAHLAKAMRYVAATVLFNSLFEDVLHIQTPFPSPIRAFKESLDNGDNIPSLAWNVAGELIEPIPVVGAARYGKGPTGPGGELLQESVKFVKQEPTARPWWELGGKWFGVPGTAQLGKSVRAAKRGESRYGQIVGTYTPPSAKLKTMRGLRDRLPGLRSLE